MLKTAAILILALLALVGCGGGGDDGEVAPVVLLDATVTKAPTVPGGSPSAVIVEVQSPQYATTSTPGEVQVCADVAWTQTVLQASPLTMHTIMKNAGPETSAISAMAPGTVGANALNFKRCGRYQSGGFAGNSRATMRFELRSAANTVGYLGDYAATVRWVVTQQ